MRPALLAISLLSALLVGTTGHAANQVATPAAATTPIAQRAADQRFADLSRRWLDGYLKLNPISATQTGDHRFDTEVDDLSAAGRRKSLDFSQRTLAALDAIDARKLSRANQVDAALLRNQLRSDVWYGQTYQAWAWDPQVYSSMTGDALYTLMARDFAPLPQRLKAATARMRKLPQLLDQMRANLDPARVPLIHAQTVAKQNHGVIDIMNTMIQPHAQVLAAPDRAALEAAMADLRKAVDAHQIWLDKTLVPQAKGDFRLGQKRYDEKLAFTLNSTLSRSDIKSRAQAAIAQTRAEMYAIARTVLQGKADAPASPEQPTAEQQQALIQAALEIAYADRPTRANLVAAAEQTLADATDFVRKKNLVSLPDSPVKIILMPEFQRGVSVAYCDSPGPLDRGLDTFYAVSPIPEDWKQSQVDSFLREYNRRSIAELGIHEAMPGHYVQIWHSNKYPSTLRAVLSSGSFVEGWAVYAERQMADLGFMDADPLMQLIQRKWALRGAANAIIDQGIQVDGMSREEAMKLMTVTTFQEEREAAGKWVRAQLTSTQLATYFVGYSEWADLRQEAQQRSKGPIDARAFHDQALSYGSPGVRFVRALMFDLPIQ
jgi:uncharacterized protein (DUF885 family)